VEHVVILAQLCGMSHRGRDRIQRGSEPAERSCFPDVHTLQGQQSNHRRLLWSLVTTVVFERCFLSFPNGPGKE
jgi:hypothetical protein